ncbi:MAG: HlyD family efflux transporter periplasmic adaptor subunit, partial [Rikenellaceae bacterium]|nr:HlyD family efflux transporter periplasmic adaptor subunit [Rikenellaceae bacterium]
LQQSETDCRSAELRLNNLKKDFQGGALRVTSPQAGYVTEVFVNQGDFVTIGQPLFTVSKNRNVVLRAEVSPQYAAKLSQVVSANFRTSAGADFISVRELGGNVISYGRQIDPQSHLIPFYFSVPYRTDFVAGSFAEVKLVMRDGALQIVVPKEALVEDFGLFFVYTKDDHGFEKREVVPSGSDGRRVAISRGIAEGEEIVAQGAPRLKLIERLGSLGAEAAHSGHSH